MTSRDLFIQRTWVGLLLGLLACVTIPSLAFAQSPLGVTRLQPAQPGAGVQHRSDATIEVKAAVWTRDERLVAAVISPRGSDSPTRMAVALWDAATGRLEGWIALPNEFESQAVYIRTLALFASEWKAEFNVALAITTTIAPGECGNLLLYGQFGPSDIGWRPETDVNTPAICGPSEAAELTSPSRKLALRSRAAGLVIRRQGRRDLTLEVPAETTREHPPAPVYRLGDAAVRTLPKIVLQTMSSAEAAKRAIWSADGQRVVALMGSRGSDAASDMALLIWDPWRGDIVKRVPLPPIPGASDFLVHELRIDAKTDIEIRGSVRTAAGACESMLLEYSLIRFIRMGARYDLNRAENCQRSSSPEAMSPDGKFAIDLGGGRLAVRETASGKTVAVLDKPEALLLGAASLSPDGKSIALVGERATGDERSLLLLNFDSAKFSASPLSPSDNSRETIVWLDSGRPTVVGQPEAEIFAMPHGAGAAEPPTLSGAPQPRRLLATSDGIRWLEYDPAARSVARVSILHGFEQREALFQNVVAAGTLPDAPMAWIATRSTGLVWIDRDELLPGEDQSPVTYFLPGGKFFAQAGYAYDTNLPADTDLFRWADDGDGLNSLEPQTYMRLLFVPQLIRQQIACSRTPDCRGVKLSGSAGTNGALPDVAIESVKPGSRPNTADVVITAKQGQRVNSRGKTKTSGGAFNLRLFRNGALVAQYPPVEQADDPDVAAWRERNRLPLGPDLTARIPLTVALPTRTQAQDIRFTAYAFNEDRVKSETARAEYVAPPVSVPRPRRAFVVAIGIDAYQEERLRLRFAASDARLLGQRLAAIPGYQVRRTVLASDAQSGLAVTAAMIGQVLQILAGKDVDAARRALAKAGVDSSQLAPSTPDDIVIISFSGHGWADKAGAFYFAPAEAEWPAGPEPVRTTMVSAAQIAERLRDVDAAEMALIIDACHSAASVDSGGFKPGPMGDPGLGQLAFDKGIRILAATQADDVALEDPALRQGLLTYALAGEGITAKGGKADGNGDGRITLDEWLNYAVMRMPSLSSDVRLGRLVTDAGGARGWVRVNAAAAKPPMQEPSLFDFTQRQSTVVLREGVGR